MALRITIDIFSGRPNPVIELKGKEAQDVMARLQPASRLTRKGVETVETPILGYRGLVVEQLTTAARGLPKSFRVADGSLLGQNLAHRAADESFEEFFFGSKGPLAKSKVAKNIRAFVREQVGRSREARVMRARPPIVFPPKVVCTCAPLYEPAWWNDAGQKQFNNNCYNYATNYRSDTFAQPGLAAGAMYTDLTCASVKPAAVADALIDSPRAKNKCPKEGHLVALVIAPGIDFHWYRKGRNGYWSHKPGSTPVTNLDNSGKAIPDPRTADRGPYTDFCTFMVVMHGHIKIQ